MCVCGQRDLRLAQKIKTGIENSRNARAAGSGVDTGEGTMENVTVPEFGLVAQLKGESSNRRLGVELFGDSENSDR